MKNLRIWMALITWMGLSAPVWAGGKNKIPYDDFEWQIYQSEHFKVFFYEAERHLLPQVVDMAEAAYANNSELLQHQINFKVPLVIYKTHEEFEQTNIFSGFIPRYVGAFAEPFQSRMVLPIDLPEEELYQLIAHELTHIFQYDMLFNNKISTIIRANAPTWFIEGMASYVADDESNLDRMVLRDSAINSNFASLSQLSSLSFLAYRVGHSAFEFIEKEYGIEGVRNLLWEYRKNIGGSVESAIRKALDIEPEEFDRKFKKYLRKRYIDLLPVKEEPDDYAREIRTRKVFTTLSPDLSPSGDLFAAFVPLKNSLDLVLISTKDGRLFKNLTPGYTNVYTELSVNPFNGTNDLAWSTDGNEIAFMARREGTNILLVVNVLTAEIVENIKFPNIKSLESPCFGKDSNDLYFVGDENGQTDVFRLNRATGQAENLTRDTESDKNPRISPDGKELVYSSDRDGFLKIMVLDLETGEKTQITSGLGNDIQASFSQDMSKIYFSSDRYEDIYNIFGVELETGKLFNYTDVLTGAFSPQERIVFDHREGEETKQLVFTAYYEGRFRIYRMDDFATRERPYDVGSDSYSNVKDHKMSVGHTLDMENFSAYRLKSNFTVSGVDVTAGVTDDGRFVSNTAVAFGDVLGNHNLSVSAYSVSSYESYNAAYINRKNRLQWGAQLDSFQYFLVDRYFQPGERIDRLYKYNTLIGYLRYPFSLFSRVDIGGGVTDQDTYRPVPFRVGDDLFFNYEQADFTVPIAFIGFSRDTLRYQSFGPIQGMGFDATYTEAFGEFRAANLEFRAYKELSRRSLFAFRLRGDASEGDTPQLFYLGGNNNLRGDYFYNEFVGTRRLLSQMEWRFPLIDALVFPGFALQQIRGSVFVDVGGTWFEDSDFEFEFEGDTFNGDDPNPNFLLGTYGLDLSMYFFGLELHWTWARRTNFEEFPSNSRFSFWIGRTF
ncbi:MAG: PD40 domain-containing protein [Acidobacteria bacterium]|nr:PD40 domain-containing protein [Acidobacteriota bacterium]